jgi:single-stranded-DNA-specific exonuclease
MSAPENSPAARDARSPAAATRLREALGVTRTFAELLAARGFDDPEATRSFLDPRLSSLTPPDAMLDRELAADRLARAVSRGERVVVFGDYDVDGITSTAILTLALRALGGDVTPLLASRFDGGYGFSARALERVRALSPGLLVTCDCGTSDHPRLEDARRAGIDVVVIDHHLVPPEPLPALAFLNPHRPDCGFAFKHLASCGLALSVVGAVRARLGANFDLRPLLDLVALGTVADVAPLVGDNRALVRAGLARLATTSRPGLEALADVAGLAPGLPVTGQDVSFRLAPRINAPGRLGAPDPSLALLLETDRARARMLAMRLEEDTKRRREIERAIVEAALAQIEETGQAERPGIVVGSEGWNVGVVGIVAARLVDRFRVPVVVVGFDGAEGRGSVRGPIGARLHDALTNCRDTLVGFGGHQAAAGVHLAQTSLERFRDAFAEACAANRDARASGPSRVADARLHEADDLAAVMADLDRLEPCGEANAPPLLRVDDVDVLAVRVMKGEHLRLTIRHGQGRLDAFGFGFAARAPREGERISMLASLRRDAFRGRASIELRLEEIRMTQASASSRG